MSFTEEQWQALCVLRHIDGAKRQASPSTQALRAVLVDGVPPTDAAKAHGLTHQAVYHSLSRSRDVQALARELAGAVDIMGAGGAFCEDEQRRDGGPAFPQGKGVGEEWVSEGGMDLRDYFAAKAMQGDLANPEVKETAAARSEWAYKMADAMIKERNK